MYTTTPAAPKETAEVLEDLRDELVRIIDAKLYGAQRSRTETERYDRSPEQDLMSQKEVCRLLRLSKPTVIDYEKRGLLHVLRIGRRVYYRRSEIMRTLEGDPSFRKALR